ncbi:nucleoside-diphosphate sugar epimerase/dehydratase [uncultured Dysosmobacter sp.]|uniref:polysaccharide biosynthesis protein n=1 Tax=uncultured Dysosmobacter sp. TaxID=2591384 RepID=UPI0026138ADE|nr:nucleoside-diphosphate sugar epimerase/dehydratase [uncultured Dysosmobacter sp.]
MRSDFQVFRRKKRELALRSTRSLLPKRRLELMGIDTAIFLTVCFLMSVLTMLDINSLSVNGRFTLGKALVLYLCVMAARLCFRVYATVWRYANVSIYLKLMTADAASGCVFFLIGRVSPAVSLGAAYTLVTVLLVMLGTLASRFVYQYLYARAGTASDLRAMRELLQGTPGHMHQVNIAIVGAGNIGAMLAGELRRNPRSHHNPYCFIDTDPAKIGSSINGIPVYAENERIVEIIKTMPVQGVVIALPDAAPEEKSRLYDLYRQTGCQVMLFDYPLGDKSGERNVGYGKRELRRFSINDLLFRDELSIASTKAKDYYRDKTVLVTGGGGSIGSELCRQIAALSPRRLVILDIYENNAYDIQQELTHKYGKDLTLETVIASVRDEKRMEEIFAEVRPDIVFHAAAHKHVPLMEHSGCEAIKNNVFGTYNVANLAEKYGTKKFVLISTDKAVNPTNIMGASKRLCEMVVQCRRDSATAFAAVRFGNVLGSNGSVIPLFKKQITAGGPVTITDKRAIRYFMTIPEAVGLVMEAGAMAKNGELFVLDMGKPVRILDLAENMIRLSGLRPYEDVDIVEIGLRPGEKLYEELLVQTEGLERTENKLVFIERDKGYSRAEVDAKLEILARAVSGVSSGEAGHYERVIEAIQATVPTYRDPEEVNRDTILAREKA